MGAYLKIAFYILLNICETPHLMKTNLYKLKVHTVKIRDIALGLSGFVRFFWWVYLRGGGLIQGEFIVNVL